MQWLDYQPIDHARHWISTYSQFLVPYPPVEIREEIVDSLDAITGLIESLEREIEVREKLYRQKMRMIFNKVENRLDSKQTNLGDICEVRSGWNFPEEYQNQKVGQIPFYKVKDTNLEGNEMKMYSSDHYLTPQDVKGLKVNLAPKGTIILPKVGLTIKTNKKRLLTQDSGYDNNLVGLIADSSKVSSSYLYHWVMNQDIIEWSNKSGAVPSIRTSTIKSLRVPIPPLKVQGEIGEDLDASSNHIEDLQKELELRKKQYAYALDRLFDFARFN